LGSDRNQQVRKRAFAREILPRADTCLKVVFPKNNGTPTVAIEDVRLNLHEAEDIGVPTDGN